MAESKIDPRGGVSPDGDLLLKWARAPHWRTEEGVALAFGLDPTEVREIRFDENTLSNRQKKKCIAHFVELAWRAVDAGDLPERAHPYQFVEWADRVGLQFHRSWEDSSGGQTGRSRRRRSVIGTAAGAVDEKDRRGTLIRKWGAAPSWTHAEGAALSMNRSPADLQSLPSSDPDVIEFTRRLTFAVRAHERHQLPQSPTPAEFVGWAATVDFPFDDEWANAVGPPSARPTLVRMEQEALMPDQCAKEEPAAADEKPLQTRPRETMLKLIIGMAIDAYGYDPRSKRSSTAREIAEELKKLDIELDQDTVRKYLTESAQFVSSDTLSRKFGRE